MAEMKPAAAVKNRKLSTERRLQGWSQARLAQALGVTTRTVIRWENGLVVPHPNHRRNLGALLGKTAKDLGLLWDLDESETQEQVPSRVLQRPAGETVAKPPVPRDPALLQTLTPADGLLGRTALFTQIKERLFAANHLTFTILSGLPGIGKTVLAAALASDADVQSRFRDGILWAPLGRQPHLLSLLIHWGTLLGVSPSDVENSQSCQAWSRMLRSAIGMREMLLIIDDVWTAKDVLALQVGGPQCTCLFTTSQSEVIFTLSQLGSITVSPLEEADGLVLLAQHVPELIHQDPQHALALVQAMDGLPLALTLIGRYLALSTFKERNWPLKETLTQLDDLKERLRPHMLTSPGGDWPSLIELAPLCLYSAIALCDRRLSPQAQAALRALAIFPPKPHSFSEEAALAMSRQPKETLDELCSIGLLENWRPGHYTLHQTIASYARANLANL